MKIKMGSVLCGLLTAGAVFVAEGNGRADVNWRGFPGIQCVAKQPSQAACITRTDLYGVQNDCNVDVTVVCPLPALVAGANATQYLTGYVYDRNPTSDVSCTFYAFYGSGAYTYSSQSSSGFASASMELNWPRAAYVNGGAGNVVTCTIPKFDATNGWSHVVTFTTIIP